MPTLNIRSFTQEFSGYIDAEKTWTGLGNLLSTFVGTEIHVPGLFDIGLDVIATSGPNIYPANDSGGFGNLYSVLLDLSEEMVGGGPHDLHSATVAAGSYLAGGYMKPNGHGYTTGNFTIRIDGVEDDGDTPFEAGDLLDDGEPLIIPGAFTTMDRLDKVEFTLSQPAKIAVKVDENPAHAHLFEVEPSITPVTGQINGQSSTNVVTVYDLAAGSYLLFLAGGYIHDQVLVKYDATVTVLASGAASVFSIAPDTADAAEGNGGNTGFTFTVVRDGDTSVAQSVTYAVTGSGANPADAADFAGNILATQTVDFAPGETSQTVTINVSGDAAIEADNGFTVTLSNPTGGAVLGARSANGTIRNDDARFAIAPHWTPNAADQKEGHTDARSFTYTITRSGDVSVAHTIDYAVTGSGANPASAADFAGAALPSATVTFNPGETSKDIAISVAGDVTLEQDENFVVTLSDPSGGATIATPSADGVIRNDDQHVTITPLSAVKAEDGETPFLFLLRRSGDTSSYFQADLAVAGSGANPAQVTNPGSDFYTGNPLPTAVFIPARQTSSVISLTVLPDATPEPDEGFTLTLSNPTAGATLITNSASGVIVNDDATSPAVLSIAATDANKIEGNAGTTPFTFTVTRTGNTAGTHTVTYSVFEKTLNVKPAAPSDFGGSFPTGTVTFNPGETSKLVTIDVVGDALPERHEDFYVALSNASSGAIVGTGVAEGVIRNDDATLSLAVRPDYGSADRKEFHSGPQPLVLEVTLAGEVDAAPTVDWAVTGFGPNPATASDFIGNALPSGTLNFEIRQEMDVISGIYFEIAGDLVLEPDEGWRVTLSNPSTGVTLANATLDGVIRNDDATLSVAAANANLAEGRFFSFPTFTVTRTGDTSVAHSATFTVSGSGGSPAAGSDFPGGVFPSGTVSFAAGETSKNIVLGVRGDKSVEPNEGYTLTLSGPSAGASIAIASAAGVIRNDDRAVRNDFNGDGVGDVLFQHGPTGQLVYAAMNAGAFQAWGAATGGLGALTVGGTGDVNGDQFADIFVQNPANGDIFVARQMGTNVPDWGIVSVALTSDWKLRGAADVNGDGFADAIVQNQSNGALLFANMANGAFQDWGVVSQHLTSRWKAVGGDDITGDGFADVVIQNLDTGDTLFANMANGQFSGWGVVTISISPEWVAKIVADVTGDGFADVVFQHAANGTALYVDMKNGVFDHWGVVAQHVTAEWLAQNASDVNADGTMDVTIQHAPSGDTVYSHMTADGFDQYGAVTTSLTPEWHLV